MIDLKHYREQLAAATDDDLRCQFLRLLAQEGRQHYMDLVQITQETVSRQSDPNTSSAPK